MFVCPQFYATFLDDMSFKNLKIIEEKDQIC